MVVRLPDETALGRAPGLATSRRIPPAVPSAAEVIGPAIGQAAEKIGGLFEKQENDQEAFQTQASFIDFQDRVSKTLLDKQKNAPPGAQGFEQGIRDEYLGAAREFYNSVPDRLKPEMDVRLRSFESRVTTSAKLFEAEEGKRHTVGRIDEASEKLAIGASQDPASAAAKVAEAERLIDSSPRLTPQEKEELKRKVRAKVTMAGQQGLIDSDPDAARAWQDSQFGGAFMTKWGKSESGNSYDPPDTPTARSSGARGKYGILRSTWIPLAREVDPSLKDKTDEEVWALAKGKENAEIQEKVGALVTRKNEAALKAQGIPVTDTTRYLANWFGAGGAAKILKADPSTPIENFLPNAKGADGVMRSPADWAKVNGVQGKTVGEVIALARTRMNESASTAPGSPTVPTTGRQFVVPEGISYQDYLKLQAYGRHRVTQLQSDLNDHALTVQQDVLLGRQEPAALGDIAAQYRRLGMGAQATYYEYLASKPELIRQWSQAGSDEQRAIILSSKAPINAAAGVSEADRKHRQALAEKFHEAGFRLEEEEQKRLRAEMINRGKSILSTAEDDLKGRAPVDQVMPRLQEAYTLAKAAGDQELLGKIEKTAGQYRAIESLRGLPTAAQEAILEKHRNELARDGGRPGQYALTATLEAEHRKYVEALGKDPWSAGTDRFSLQVQPLPDIRVASPDTIAGLRTRAAQASAVLAKEPTAAAKLVPFSDEEMALITAAFDKAPANLKAQMLGTMAAGLGPEWFARTMNAMAKKGHGALAWAGGLMGTDAMSARTIIEGQEVRKATPKVVPQGADLTMAVDEVVGTMFSGNTNAAEARAMVDDAIQAAYAKLAFDQGKTDGKFDADIASKAIKLVLGNVVGLRGQMVIPPRRDMTSADFRDVFDRLQDSDLPELHSAEGDRIDAARIKRFGVLQSAGDGRYTVRLPDRGGVLKDIPDPTRRDRDGFPLPFVLDMAPLMTRAPLAPVRQPDAVTRTPTPAAVQPLLPETRRRGAPSPGDPDQIGVSVPRRPIPPLPPQPDPSLGTLRPATVPPIPRAR